MAAITPSSTILANLGNLTLIIAKFAATADATDTWASGLSTRVVSWWATATETPGTQTNSGIAVANSSGTFTFTPDEDNQSFNLHVLVTQ